MLSTRTPSGRSSSPWWNPSQWDPWRDFQALRREVQQLSERRTGIPSSTEEFFPAIDIFDTGVGFVVRVDVPGVRDEDLDVTLNGSLLSIKGCRRGGVDSADATLLVRERSGRRFARTVGLPSEVEGEQVRATLARGVLEIVVPKRSTATHQKVTVTVSGAGAN